MTTEIREAVPADASYACQVLRRSIVECCTVDHQNNADVLAAWLGNKQPETIAAWFAAPMHYTLVAVDGDRLTGVAMLTRAGKIALCYVAPEARNTGIGRMLLERLETQAIQWGVSTLRVASTKTAQEFYRHNGYIPDGFIRTAFGTTAIAFFKRLQSASASCKKMPFNACGCSRPF